MSTPSNMPENCADEDLIAKVDGYWSRLHAYMNHKPFAEAPALPTPEETPTSDELARVASTNAWRAAMACTHNTITFQPGEPITCGDCERPLRYLSDIQLEDIKTRAQLRG